MWCWQCGRSFFSPGFSFFSPVPRNTYIRRVFFPPVCILKPAVFFLPGFWNLVLFFPPGGCFFHLIQILRAENGWFQVKNTLPGRQKHRFRNSVTNPRRVFFSHLDLFFFSPGPIKTYIHSVFFSPVCILSPVVFFLLGFWNLVVLFSTRKVFFPPDSDVPCWNYWFQEKGTKDRFIDRNKKCMHRPKQKVGKSPPHPHTHGLRGRIF